MRFKAKSLTLVFVLLFSFFFISNHVSRAYADPYGQGTYGTGNYNCNNSATCDPNASGSLTNTGTNLLFIGGGAVILIGVTLSTVIAKRKSKRSHGTPPADKN